MKRAFLIVLGLGFFLWASGALQAATITGLVLDSQGSPVSGVEIAARDPGSRVMARSVTNAEGRYLLEGLAAGQLSLTLNPLETGFQGETAVVSLGAEGLTVNWTVSTTAPALAAAAPGSGRGNPSGWERTALKAAGAIGFVGGAVTGGLALSGEFHDSLEPAALLGRVVDAEGNPVEGITVEVQGSPFKKVRTGRDGRFIIRGLPRNHTYRLTVRHEGSHIQEGTLTVESGPGGTGVTITVSSEHPPRLMLRLT